MSHNIYSYIGREAAWHELGEVTGKFMTWDEILASGHLDFSVFKSQLRDGLNRPIEAYGMFRWNKEDKLAGRKEAAVFLATVGKGYQDIHHSKGFEFNDTLVASRDGAHYATAGALGNGEVVWGLADLGLAVKIGDDLQKGYLLFATSYDGSMAHTYRICFTRVVCQNTLNIALGEKSRNVFRVKHTRNGADKLADAHKALSTLSADVHSVEEKLNFLATRKVVKESMLTVLDRLFPKQEKDGKEESSTRRDNILSSILAKYEDNDSNAFPEQRGTAYNLLNAVTNYVDHDRSSKGNGRAESALFGSGDTLKSKAYEVIYETANGLPEMRTQVIYSDAPKKPTTSATGFTGIDSIDFDAVPYAV